jgi:hypothetical protein
MDNWFGQRMGPVMLIPDPNPRPAVATRRQPSISPARRLRCRPRRSKLMAVGQAAGGSAAGARRARPTSEAATAAASRLRRGDHSSPRHGAGDPRWSPLNVLSG